MVLKARLFFVLSFVFLFVGMIFTDLPIHEKTVTRSPMIFIAPVIFMLTLALNNFKIRPMTKNLRIFSLYTGFTFVVSLFLLFFINLTRDFYAYDKNLIIKHFEAFISLSLLHFLVYFLLIQTLINLSLDLVKKIFYFFFSSLTITAFVEYLIPDILNIFHTAPKNYDRLRLLASEPSQAILVYLILSLLSLYFAGNIYLRFLLLLFSAIIFVLIKSKGAFITLILVFTISSVWLFKKVFWFLIFAMLFMATIYFFTNYVLPDLLMDIENYTSFSTRFSGLISAFLILFIYPLGLGYGSYLLLYPDILVRSYEIANNLFVSLFDINLSYAEILDIITTGINLGAKGGVAQSIMLNGWLAVIFWLTIFKNTAKYINKLAINPYQKIILKITILFTFIQLLIGSEYTLLYIVWLPIAFIEVLYYKQIRGYNLNEV